MRYRINVDKYAHGEEVSLFFRKCLIENGGQQMCRAMILVGKVAFRDMNLTHSYGLTNKVDCCILIEERSLALPPLHQYVSGTVDSINSKCIWWLK